MLSTVIIIVTVYVLGHRDILGLLGVHFNTRLKGRAKMSRGRAQNIIMPTTLLSY